jgi:hypothetical protein
MKSSLMILAFVLALALAGAWLTMNTASGGLNASVGAVIAP